MSSGLVEAIAALGSGGLVGFSLGLIGGGGSILATPLLLYLVGVRDPHTAIGTGALAVSVNAYASLIGHSRRQNVWWPCAIAFALTGTVGVLIGSTLGKVVNGQVLLFLFGIVMLCVGALMLRPRDRSEGAVRTVDRKMCVVTGTIALLAGLASGFFGIGGGFLIVPGLILATGMPTINAIGTSLLAVGTFGLITAMNYALSGLVDWTVAAEFMAGGVGGGLAGTSLATRLSVNKNTLSRVFAGLIFVVAVYVLYRSGGNLFGFSK